VISHEHLQQNANDGEGKAAMGVDLKVAKPLKSLSQKFKAISHWTSTGRVGIYTTSDGWMLEAHHRL
jgi:hypothetical protein